MKYRIAAWATVGLFVAGFWAVLASATFPSTNQVMRNLWILVSTTCPIAVVGRHYSISLYEALLANAATYGLVGLAVGAARRRLHPQH